MQSPRREILCASPLSGSYASLSLGGRLINASLSVDLPFDRLRENVKGNSPFVLSLSKHDMAYRADL